MSQKKWSEEKKQHKRIMRYRDSDIAKLEEKVRKLENERRLYQEHFAKRFKWWISLCGQNSAPDLPWLIEHDAKFMQTVSSFTW